MASVRKYYQLLLLFGLMVIYLMGCTINDKPKLVVKKIDLTPRTTILPEGIVYHAIWYPDDELKIFYDSGRRTSSIRYIIAGQNEILTLPLLSTQSCQSSDYIAPTAMSDNRLGLVQICYDRWPDNPQGRRDGRYLVAYDWETGRVEQMVASPLSDRLAASSFSWNPDFTQGVQSIGGGRNTIWWINPEGPLPMNIVIGEGRKSWSLAENLRIMDSMDQEVYFNEYDVGNAHTPVWSPDGQTIAFFASTDAIGKGGVNRMVSEYYLYLMDPGLQQPYPVLGNLHEPKSLQWSPNSQWLAFTTEWGQVGLEYAYTGLFSPSQNLLYLISPQTKGWFFDLAWSPNGEELAIVYKTYEEGMVGFEGEFDLWLYDVKDLVNGVTIP